MIAIRNLTKRFGDAVAVDDVSFDVVPGRVTGFLGPNGSGKSTTMRVIMGLDWPTSGTVTVNGRPYEGHRRPLFEVGALLDAKAIHGGRTAYNHLLSLAQSNGIPRSRVDEVIERVGLGSVAHKRAGGFSLGMSQRLGIAAALLGDPGVMLFDEPVNGLDPEGNQVGPPPAALAGRGGPNDLRLQPSDERDGAHRRPPHRDRSRTAGRGHLGGGVHRAERTELRSRAIA